MTKPIERSIAEKVPQYPILCGEVNSFVMLLIREGLRSVGLVAAHDVDSLSHSVFVCIQLSNPRKFLADRVSVDPFGDKATHLHVLVQAHPDKEDVFPFGDSRHPSNAHLFGPLDLEAVFSEKGLEFWKHKRCGSGRLDEWVHVEDTESIASARGRAA